MSDDIVEKLQVLREELHKYEIEALAQSNRVFYGRLGPAVTFAMIEIERLRSLTDWRPIESAPKDGTAVLLYRSNARRTVKVDRWLAGWWYETKIEHAPTHWLPLPEPPKA